MDQWEHVHRACAVASNIDTITFN